MAQTAQQRFIADLKTNGKTKTWLEYAAKYFTGRSEKFVREVARRSGIVIVTPKKPIIKPTLIKDNTDSGPTPQEKAYLEKLRKVGIYGTAQQMTEEFMGVGHNPEWALGVRRKFNYTVKEKKPTPTTILEDTRRTYETNELKDQNRELANQLLTMQRSLEKYVNIEGYDPKKFAIQTPEKKGAHEAAVILQWSDWHVEETVLSTTVNGLNSYDIPLAKKRCTAIFKNGLKLIDIQRAGVDIKDLVIHLGGDFITGYIHPEGEQTNELSPINACKYAIDLLVSGIEYYLSNGGFNQIRIVCSRGNHGRTTKKMQSNDFEMNNEMFIYYFLMTHFKKEPRILFQATESSYSYLTVYDRTLRFFHGHQVKYKGGIGGMTVPMVKLILRLDANKPAYYNFMGDKHTYCQPTPDCQVNGSLIGYNAYAAEFGLPFQQAIQAFTLLDSKRGVTVKAPIFAD